MKTQNEEQNEEQKIEAIKALYDAIGKSFAEVYTEMGKAIANLANAPKETER